MYHEGYSLGDVVGAPRKKRWRAKLRETDPERWEQYKARERERARANRRRASRPSRDVKVVMCHDDYAELQKYAAKHNVNMSEAIRTFCTWGLETMREG